MKKLVEGKIKLEVETSSVVSKDMPVFYNPVMGLNRTISVLLLNSLDKKNMQIGIPLAGSGVRGIRFMCELEKGKIKNITFNDLSPQAVKAIKKNLKLNGFKLNEDIAIRNQDANLFLLSSNGYDYIDIDPFGTPNPYLDSAIRRLSREGILAVTATDTSSLSGTHVKACQRKYWARPIRTEIMHEVGTRILIRKCQLVAAQYDKALVPVFCYSKDHYMRIFFICHKGKEHVDKLIKLHGEYLEGGPMFLGKLYDEKLCKKIYEKYMKIDKPKKSVERLLRRILQESKIHTIGFYHIPTFVKRNGLKIIPTQERIIEAIIKKGYECSETHFKENSLRTNIDENKLKELILELT